MDNLLGQIINDLEKESFLKGNNRVKEARSKEGISQFELAKRSNIAQSNISQIENGKIFPYPGWRKRIAAALNLEEDYLFFENYSDKNLNKEKSREKIKLREKELTKELIEATVNFIVENCLNADKFVGSINGYLIKNELIRKEYFNG